MKKVLTIVFIYFSLYDLAFGQATDSTIEIRLSILQHKTIGEKNEMALGVSVINHTGQNIYIPDFLLFATYAGIHFYQKEGSEWREIDIVTREFYDNILKQMTEKRAPGSFSSRIDQLPPPHFEANTISTFYNQVEIKNDKKMDSIYASFLAKSKSSRKWALEDRKPIFLKAGDEIINYTARNIDYLQTQQKEYKISFFTEKRDIQKYHFADSIEHFVDGSRILAYPPQINEYKLFLPKTITSNVIYFTTFSDADLKRK